MPAQNPEHRPARAGTPHGKNHNPEQQTQTPQSHCHRKAKKLALQAPHTLIPDSLLLSPHPTVGLFPNRHRLYIAYTEGP
jgi:hypothetical protein